MDCHFLLKGIFPNQGLNLGLLHCRQTLYHLSHQGSPLKGSAYSRNSSEGLLYNKAKGHRQQATQTKRVSRSQHKVKEIQFCWLHDKYKILWTSRPSTQNVALNTDFRSSAFLRSLISSQVSFLIFHSHTVLLFSLGHILPFLTIKSLIQLSINFSILKIKT